MVGHLNEEQIIAVLKENALGRIGCSDGKQSYIVPVNYYFDGNAIVVHSEVGKKIKMMRQNPNVCFEVDEMTDFTNWRSVIIFGRYQEIEDEEEQKEVMDAYINSMMRIKLSETALLPEIHAARLHHRTGPLETVIYKIVIEKMTGRYEYGTE
jgi:nitroimidazol reductase NimA-like FMN-containing flavoprotein (pyridoxamine 5'-phosphate oxidase superfamily)